MKSVPELAAEWQVSESQVKKWLQNGDLQGVKVGRAWKVLPDQEKPAEKQREPKLVDPIHVSPAVLEWMQQAAEEGNPVMAARLAEWKRDPRTVHLLKKEESPDS